MWSLDPYGYLVRLGNRAVRAAKHPETCICLQSKPCARSTGTQSRILITILCPYFKPHPHTRNDQVRVQIRDPCFEPVVFFGQIPYHTMTPIRYIDHKPFESAQLKGPSFQAMAQVYDINPSEDSALHSQAATPAVRVMSSSWPCRARVYSVVGSSKVKGLQGEGLYVCYIPIHVQILRMM